MSSGLCGALTGAWGLRRLELQDFASGLYGPCPLEQPRIDREHLRLGAVIPQAVRREPVHPAVLIRLGG